MKKHTNGLLLGASCWSIALMGLSSAPAFAQGEPVITTEDVDTQEAGNDRDIVVTGTIVRGIKPVGSNVISQDRQEIDTLGVIDTRQVIAQLPQSNYFLELPQPGGTNVLQGTPRIPVSRPGLRNIPGFNSGSGQRTLVLIDGHRVVPTGIEQQVVELGVVPPGILQRTEVILDGASAVYGSDAVEGVINLITRKRFDGTEVSGRFGLGTDYWQADAGITHGLAWGTGGLTLNYDFSKSSNLLQKDRTYLQPIDYINFDPPQLAGVQCETPNVRASGTAGVRYTHSVQNDVVVPGPSYCNAAADSTFTPAQEMHSGFATFSQDMDDWLTFEVSGLYTHRVSEANTGPFAATSTIQPTAFFYRPTPGLPGAHQVAYNFAPVFGNDSGVSRTTIQVWQVNPEIRADVGSGWQARLAGAYGESNLQVFQNRLNSVALGSAVNRTAAQGGATVAVNPYNIAQTSQAVLQSLIGEVNNRSKFTFKQARLVADGPLLTLPGGEIRAALGAEWMQTKVRVDRVDENFFTPIARAFGDEEVKAVFGELIVPVVGPDNAMPGIQALTLSASGRYDKYQNVDNFSPKLAATYQPFEWVTVRGNWGKSFRGPNAIDKLGANQSVIRNVAINTNPTRVDPRYNFSWNQTAFRQLYLTGTIPDLKPESSTNWSVGLDIRPPVGDTTELTLSGTYWNIDFRDTIAFAVIGSDVTPNFLIPGNPSKVCYPPPANLGDRNQPVVGASVGPLCSAAEVQAFVALASTGPGALAAIEASGGTVATLLDGRVRNLGGAQVEGLDFSARLRQEVPFGSLDASANVAVPLKVDTQLYPGAPTTDNIEFGTPKWQLTASAGATVGNVRAQATVRHRPSYVPNPNTPRLSSQARIDPFTVFDLAFRYDLKGRNWFSQDMTLSLNINNVFDSHPPLSLTQGGGVTGGQTLGRLFILGLTKKLGGE